MPSQSDAPSEAKKIHGDPSKMNVADIIRHLECSGRHAAFVRHEAANLLRAASLPSTSAPQPTGEHRNWCDGRYGAACSCDMNAPLSETPRGDTAKWAEWAVRALVRLAQRILAESNLSCGKNWPAGQEWHELGHTSQHAFMRAARAECGVPHDAYRDAVQSAMDAGVDLDSIWQEMEHAKTAPNGGCKESEQPAPTNSSAGPYCSGHTPPVSSEKEQLTPYPGRREMQERIDQLERELAATLARERQAAISISALMSELDKDKDKAAQSATAPLSTLLAQAELMASTGGSATHIVELIRSIASTAKPEQ